jgi:hypothetical protein
MISQLLGVGIYDLPFKGWRQKLRGRKTVEELCEWWSSMAMAIAAGIAAS